MSVERLGMSDIIERAMVKSDMTIHGLARRTGLSYATVYGLIKYRRDIKMETLVRLCAALHLELRPMSD